MSASLPCRVCGVAVHGDHEGKGYKAGSYKFAVCNAHVERFEMVRNTVADTAVRQLGRLIDRKLPGARTVMRTAANVLEALSLNEELNE